MNQKNFLIIAVFTFITVAAWISATIYHVRASSTVSESLQKQIEPITGSFDTGVIQTLKKQRKSVNLLPETPLPASEGGKLNL